MNSCEHTNGIIVTGATGFVGQYTVKNLSKMNCDVFAISRFPQGKYQGDCINWIVGDLKSQDSFNSIVKQISKASVLIHLAADVSVPGDSKTVANNIGSTLSALEIARLVGVKHFIYLSSIPVIGKVICTPIDEAHPVCPQTPYHWSKYLGEKMVENYMRYFDSSCILRIPSPIGLGMRRTVFLYSVIERMMNNEDVEVYGTGKRIQNYLDVRDLADTITKVAVKGIDGFFLLGGEKSVSNRGLVELCKEVTNSKSRISYNKHPDVQENDCWIVTSNKARETFGFSPKYDLVSTCRWIFEAMT